MIAKIPDNEEERIEALYNFRILDTPEESDFDEIVKLASEICEVPISLISLVDMHRQWFKSKIGLEDRETSRDYAFCSHAILEDDLFVVEDAKQDLRFSSNPLVEEYPHIRFYAGYPLKTYNNIKLGTLCVIDSVPRKLTKFQENSLKILANQIIDKLDLRLRNIQLEEANERLKILNKRQQKLNGYNSKLLSIIGHDLKSPVAAVSSYLDVFGTVETQEDFIENLELLKEQMNGLNLLLNNLLEWSTLQFTHSKIKLTDFNVYDVLENELKNQRKKILNKGNSLVNNIPRDFIVRSDINIVKFVFRNLINNSNKFTEKGEIRIDCEMDQNKYVFKVTDTGIGIEESRIPDLLNWEVRDSTPGSCGEMGSGLGLKIVNEMLEKLGGKLEIFSEVEKGSIFQFSIKIFK